MTKLIGFRGAGASLLLWATLTATGAAAQQMEATGFSNSPRLSPVRYLSTEEFDNFKRAERLTAEDQRLAQLARLAPELTYFTPEWWKGTVVLADGRGISSRAMRYNMALRAIELRDSAGQAPRLLAADKLRGATLNKGQSAAQYLFESHPYRSNDGEQGHNLFEPVTLTGDVRLYLLHEVMEKQAQKVVALNVEVWPAQLMRVTRLYAIRPGQKELRELLLDRSSILRLFGKRSSEMAAYAKEHQLNLSDITGAVQLVTYYNQTTPAAP